jgi:hypothetical protein
MSFTLLFVLFYRGRCVNADEFKNCWKIIKVIFSLKIILWGLIQIIIFVRGMPSGCVSGLHIFGMVNAVVHVFLLSVVMAELGKLRKKMLPIALQFFLAFFNVYYGFESISELQPDGQYQGTIRAYQIWMIVVGLFEAVFMVLVVFLYRLHRCGIPIAKFGCVLVILYGMKVVGWLGAQIYNMIFRMTALRTCSGGLFVYTIINLLLHVVFLVVVFKRRKRI